MNIIKTLTDWLTWRSKDWRKAGVDNRYAREITNTKQGD